MERNVYFGGRGMQFVLIGPPGVVLLVVTDARWALGDVRMVNDAAREARDLTCRDHLSVHKVIAMAF